MTHSKKCSIKSNTFCPLPWIHLSTRPNGHTRICCTANASAVGPIGKEKHPEIGVIKNDNGLPANLANTSINDSLNNEYMKNIRQKMLNSEIPESCTKCFDEERNGFFSKRNWETKYWQELVDYEQLIEDTNEDGSIDPKLKYIDLRLGSKCNLKCVMCSPHDSSKWINDWKQLHPKLSKEMQANFDWSPIQNGGKYNWYKNQRFWDDLFDHLDSIRQLYFAGGESTIIEEHYTLLEECVKRGVAKNIELRYNSNGIEISDRLFNLWNEFDKVKFHFSVDNIYGMNDYIRFPSKWNIISNNLHIMDQLPDHINVGIACAVQALNIYYLPEFIDWKLSQNFKKINKWPDAAGLIEFHLVYHPAFLNIKILPVNFKQKIKDKFENYYQTLINRFGHIEGFTEHQCSIPRLQGLINFMMENNWSERMPHFREYITKLDNLRGTNFVKTFPEMKELLDV